MQKEGATNTEVCMTLVSAPKQSLERQLWYVDDSTKAHWGEEQLIEEAEAEENLEEK